MKYLRRKLKKFQQNFVWLFKNSAFFMQKQMAIHPESRSFNKELTLQTGGFFLTDGNTNRKINSLEPWDNTRRDMIILLLRTICQHNVQGEFVELGVYKGYTARLIHHYTPERKLNLFDTFDGFPKKNIITDKEKVNNTVSNRSFKDTSTEYVLKNISPQNDNISIYKGYFPDTIPQEFENKKFAFVHLDADLYEPTLAGLTYFHERMSAGGFILIHDYNAWVGARKAVDDFFTSKKEIPIPMPDSSGSALIQIL